MKQQNTLNQAFVTSNICYNFGAAFDLLNPLIHTNCETMICIDLKDNSFYKRYIKTTESHLQLIIDRFITQINNLEQRVF